MSPGVEQEVAWHIGYLLSQLVWECRVLRGVRSAGQAWFEGTVERQCIAGQDGPVGVP